MCKKGAQLYLEWSKDILEATRTSTLPDRRMCTNQLTVQGRQALNEQKKEQIEDSEDK